MLLLFSNYFSFAQDVQELTFSGGAPLNTYIPSVTFRILEEALKKNGIKLNAVHYPSLRSLSASNSGELDGELHRVFNLHEITKGKYTNLLRIESELLSVSMVAYAIKKIKVNSWKDLEGYSIGFFRGRNNIKDAISIVVKKENIQYLNSDQQAFEMLKKGRIDVVITDKVRGENYLKSDVRYAEITNVGRLSEARIYSYIHKKHHELVKELAKTIEVMKEKGEVSKIIFEVNKTFEEK